MNNGIQIRVKGKVQGVGFRPYVWQLAHRLKLCGSVSNDGAGVLIHLYPSENIERFISELSAGCPPLAHIDSIASQPWQWTTIPTAFEIEHSGAGQMDTQVVPDAATCEACRREMNDPANRRYRYPFINCTHCGPRFTIIRRMPYDRPFTAMADFPLCPRCLAEYQHPADRRFHAQPNACAQCGPQVWSAAGAAQRQAEGDEAILQAAAALLTGKIVAIKGIGGFHLACDATNTPAVQRLRQRKHRPGKPLAVMSPDAAWLERCADVADMPAALRLLESTAAPIVLLPLRRDGPLSEAIAPGLCEVGLMLPANPLQHLLLAQVNRPLVMTSGNAGGKPPALTNAQALEQLSGIADLWLMHNRDIVQRADDSLVRLLDHDLFNNRAEMLRRARGYVPDALPLPPGFVGQPALLAMGADLKNTFCLLREENAIVSQHLGDLADGDIERQYRQSIALFENIYRFAPNAVVVDAHPGYISHRLGKDLAEQRQIPCIEVLHHHAHIVSCLAEHRWPRDAGPVIGLALDGIGYGADGQWWGGECLLADYARCRHSGGLPAVALPGGDLAARQPWRNLLAQWLRFVPDWASLPEAAAIPADPSALLSKAIERGINAPLASSTGRLFDAVAAATGFAALSQSWEGEAACWLESLARRSRQWQPPVTLPLLADNRLDLAIFWRQWLAYRAAPADRAYAFHLALAQGFAALARRAAEQHGVNTVVLCGGVMHNRLLSELLHQQLHGFTILQPQRLPAGDGGLSLGQALIAAERLS
ncbi:MULTISPECIES: carbamoyltransferase HypF [unclassified Brenneria]|uniref:carbamoyltransferase HypF n=1 Tax=unclassified Brenneria TaxID=2634434 RepID=UPI0018F07942|nr:carbamoyltransferase HypF [Brenneria sp. L3-3C-1]MBJ7221335.1 carbamoyltransferase HypF [Brenneria sp. L3-3C-1]MEE3642579.1 carbamoyltransferase HypF [Brenneria sp. L3_3C_1]